MESKINENEGLLPSTIVVVIFGLALSFVSFFTASLIVWTTYLLWSLYATVQMEGYKKIGLRNLALEVIVLLVIAISLLPTSSFFQTFLGVLVLALTGVTTITILDARGQTTSDFFIVISSSVVGSSL